MLSAIVHKDLTHYEPKVAAGLSLRALLCTGAALATGVLMGAYLTWVLGLPFESVSTLIYASTIPLWALGFWQPHGMRPERWLPLWLRHHGGASQLTYENAGRLGGGTQLRHTRGQRLRSPSYTRFVKNTNAHERHRPTDPYRESETA